MDEDRILKHPRLRRPLGCGILEGWPWRVLEDQVPQCLLLLVVVFVFPQTTTQKVQKGRKLFLETYFIISRTSNKTKDFSAISRFYLIFLFVLVSLSPPTYYIAPSSVTQIIRRLRTSSVYGKQERYIFKSGLPILIYYSPSSACPRSSLTRHVHTFLQFPCRMF